MRTARSGTSLALRVAAAMVNLTSSASVIL
jgi:hypothetical protein